MHLAGSLLAGLRQRLDEVLPVHVIEIDAFAGVAAAHHVVHGPGVFKAQFSRHVRLDALAARYVKSNNELFYG